MRTFSWESYQSCCQIFRRGEADPDAYVVLTHSDGTNGEYIITHMSEPDGDYVTIKGHRRDNPLHRFTAQMWVRGRAPSKSAAEFQGEQHENVRHPPHDTLQQNLNRPIQVTCSDGPYMLTFTDVGDLGLDADHTFTVCGHNAIGETFSGTFNDRTRAGLLTIWTLIT